MLNNNFNELVHKYKKYRNKKRKKVALIFIAFFAIIGAIFYFFNKSSLMQIPQENIQKNQNVTTSETTPAKTEEQITQNNSLPPITKPKTQEPKNITKSTPTSTENKSAISSPKKEQEFELKVSSSKNLYQLLVQHKNDKSYKSAIEIAQFYYNTKNYKKAVKWAIEASKKDPKQAKAWIIYAKSKVALGKTDVAKKALAIYLKHNFSQEAQDLLNSL